MKRFWLPLTLVLIHAALVAVMGAAIASSSDGEAEMGWCLFFFIDFPVSLCIFAPPPTFSSTLSSFAFPILFLGTIQWGMIGILLQTIVNWFHRGKGTEHGDP